ncbi:MAG: hypothetical protein ABIM17_03190 [candidate division WOR-3 bacterium]
MDMEQKVRKFLSDLTIDGFKLRPISIMFQNPLYILSYTHKKFGDRLILLYHHEWVDRAIELFHLIDYPGFEEENELKFSIYELKKELQHLVYQKILDIEELLFTDPALVLRLVEELETKNWIVEELTKEFNFSISEDLIPFTFFIKRDFLGFKVLLQYMTEPYFEFRLHFDTFELRFTNLNPNVSLDMLLKCLFLVNDVREITQESLMGLLNPPLKMFLDDLSEGFRQGIDFSKVSDVLTTFGVLQEYQEDKKESLRYFACDGVNLHPARIFADEREINSLDNTQRFYPYYHKESFSDLFRPKFRIRQIDFSTLELTYYTVLLDGNALIGIPVRYYLKPAFFRDLKNFIFGKVFQFTEKKT